MGGQECPPRRARRGCGAPRPRAPRAARALSVLQLEIVHPRDELNAVRLRRCAARCRWSVARRAGTDGPRRWRGLTASGGRDPPPASRACGRVGPARPAREPRCAGRRAGREAERAFHCCGAGRLPAPQAPRRLDVPPESLHALGPGRDLYPAVADLIREPGLSLLRAPRPRRAWRRARSPRTVALAHGGQRGPHLLQSAAPSPRARPGSAPAWTRSVSRWRASQSARGRRPRRSCHR